MTQGHTEALRRRRMLLQLRIARRDEARQFRDMAPRLVERGMRRLSRLPASRVMDLMRGYGSLHLLDERVDWSRVPGHSGVYWQTPGERDHAFTVALRSCFEPETRLALIFHTAESALVMSCGETVEAADAILPQLRDTLWVVPWRASPALVEVSFIDKQICWHADLPEVKDHDQTR